MRRRPSRLLPILGLFVVTGSSVVVAGNYYVNAVPSAIPTVSVDPGALDPIPEDNAPAGPAENYLLVGTDSRSNADKNDVDYGGIINNNVSKADNGQGSQRSDTMLVLRYDPKTKHGVMMSIPRDLRVTIADTGKRDKINSAMERDDPTKAVSNLIQTVRGIGIPISHYVEIDFGGFKQVVDAIGGVKVQFLHPTQDFATGLDIPRATCLTMNGVQSREYVRSRYLKIFVNGKWHTDGSSDIGRMARQQDFLKRALNQTIVKVSSDPGILSRLITAGNASVKVDSGTNLTKFAGGLRSMSKGALDSYTLPNTPKGDDLVMIDKEAAPLLAFFRGETPTVETPAPAAPAPATTVKGSKAATTLPQAPPTSAEPNPLDEPFVPVTDC